MNSKWVVIYTRSNFEKKLAQHLDKFKIESYLPIQKIRKQWKDRKKWVDELLFRSYVFIRKEDYEKSRESICKIDGFIRVLYSNNKPLYVSNIEIENLKQITSQSFKLTIESIDPKEGDIIFLKDFNIEGIISRITKANKVIIYVPTLNYYITVSYSDIK